jgi:Zn-dependent protease
MLKEFIKPELFILIPVLYLYGMALKKSLVADKNIPWILGASSIILCCFFIVAISEIKTLQEALMSLFTGVTQGVLCAGASVYVNQLIKQNSKSE